MTPTRAHPMSIGFQVAVYFAANPEEALTVEDICVKFGANQAAAASAMRSARENGLVAVQTEDYGGGKTVLYTPGPALLRLLGVAA